MIGKASGESYTERGMGMSKEKEDKKWEILKLSEEVYNDIYQKGYDARIYEN